MAIKINNRIKIQTGRLTKEQILQLRKSFTHINPMYFRLKQKGFYPGAKEPREYETWGIENGDLTFPRGRLADILQITGPVDIENNSEEGKNVDIPFKLDLYDYQEELVAGAIETDNCLIKSPTGSGKTITAIAIASKIGKSTLVVLHRGALLSQWQERICAATGLQSSDIGVIRGPKFELKPITLAMYQTMTRMDDRKWDKLNSYFGVTIVDEVHRCAASTFLKVVDRCKSRYRIGLSADHTRADGKHFLVEDIFGQLSLSVSQSELIHRKFVHDVEVKLVETDFFSDSYDLQRRTARMREDGMEFADILMELRKTHPSLKIDDVPLGVPEYVGLVDDLLDNEARNEQFSRLVESEAGAGHTVLVFSGRVDHCKTLVDKFNSIGIPSGLLIGGKQYEQEFNSTVDGLKSGRLSVGVGTIQALGEATDIPAADRGVVLVPVQAKQPWGQIRGRLARNSESKSDAVIYYAWDKLQFRDGPVKNMRAWNLNCKVMTLEGNEQTAKEYLK